MRTESVTEIQNQVRLEAAVIPLAVGLTITVLASASYYYRFFRTLSFFYSHNPFTSPGAFCSGGAVALGAKATPFASGAFKAALLSKLLLDMKIFYEELHESSEMVKRKWRGEFAPLSFISCRQTHPSRLQAFLGEHFYSTSLSFIEATKETTKEVASLFSKTVEAATTLCDFYMVLNGDLITETAVTIHLFENKEKYQTILENETKAIADRLFENSGALNRVLEVIDPSKTCTAENIKERLPEMIRFGGAYLDKVIDAASSLVSIDKAPETPRPRLIPKFKGQYPPYGGQNSVYEEWKTSKANLKKQNASYLPNANSLSKNISSFQEAGRNFSEKFQKAASNVQTMGAFFFSFFS